MVARPTISTSSFKVIPAQETSPSVDARAPEERLAEESRAEVRSRVEDVIYMLDLFFLGSVRALGPCADSGQ